MASFLALTGFMGSGKTSVGAAVAARLGWRFVDLDEEFTQREGSISNFFREQGEAAFRKKEAELLATVLAQERGGSPRSGLVLALGGGTLESAEAVEMLRSRRGVVLLDVPAEEAWARVKGSGRPLATDRETFTTLWQQRRERYQRVSDWVVPVRGREIEEVAQDVVQMVETAGDQWDGLWGRRLPSARGSSLIVGGVGAAALLEGQVRSLREAGSRTFVVTDENVLRHWGRRMLPLLQCDEGDRLFVIKPGEASKDVATLAACWDWLARSRARRQDVVVALGGGVVGDLAGFAAATYQRGVALWQVPTSLLAQVDSSVGGKTAVNLAVGKNLVGAFYQPDLVVIDPETLTTLPEQEYLSGLGEVVKHALLMSPEAFASLEDRAVGLAARDLHTLAQVSKENIGFKATVVEEDERERGPRAMLNLGHTFAHALEVTEGYGSLLHGHAVALGLLVSLAVSETLLALDESVRARTRELLQQLGLPTSIKLPPSEALLAAAAHDKKISAESTGFVGLQEIGRPVWGLNVPAEILLEAAEAVADE